MPAGPAHLAEVVKPSAEPALGASLQQTLRHSLFGELGHGCVLKGLAVHCGHASKQSKAEQARHVGTGQHGYFAGAPGSEQLELKFLKQLWLRYTHLAFVAMARGHWRAMASQVLVMLVPQDTPSLRHQHIKPLCGQQMDHETAGGTCTGSTVTWRALVATSHAGTVRALPV